MLALIKSISKAEWRFWLKILIALLILTSLTRIYIIANTPPGYQWTGALSFSSPDRFVYISYIEQARAGNFIFEDLYTSPEESAPMFNVFWLSLGLLAKLTGASANLILEISRLLFIIPLLFVVYLLIAVFVPDLRQRKTAFFLAVFAGGLGAYFFPLIYYLGMYGRASLDLPIDLTTPELFVFLTSYYSVHFIASLAAFGAIILFTVLAINKKRPVYSIPTGFIGLILANFHPFTFIIASFVFLSYWLFCLFKDRPSFLFLSKYWLIFYFISLPSIIYHLLMLHTPWWQNQAWGSKTGADNILMIFIGYGLLFILAAFALYLDHQNKIKIKHSRFLLIWLIAQTVLVLLPSGVQRRFLEGQGLVLSILSSYSLLYIFKKKSKLFIGKMLSNKAVVALMFVVVFSMSFVFFMWIDYHNSNNLRESMYVKKDRLQALAEIKKYTKSDELILSDLNNSVLIPAVAIRRIFIGHPIETINFNSKLKVLEQIAYSENKDLREEIIKRNNIKYLFYDPDMDIWQHELENETYLRKVMERGGYSLYAVIE